MRSSRAPGSVPTSRSTPGPVARCASTRRVGVVEAAEPGRSLSFWWTTPDGDEPASRVDVEIQRVGDITRLWVREVQLDLDAHALLRPPSALARA